MWVFATKDERSRSSRPKLQPGNHNAANAKFGGVEQSDDNSVDDGTCSGQESIMCEMRVQDRAQGKPRIVQSVLQVAPGCRHF